MKLIIENWRRFLKEQSEDSSSLIQFIMRSNEIEGYQVSADEVQDALEGQEQGYPLTYVAQNPHIYSHLAGLQAARSGSTSVADVLNVHRAMGPGALEAGVPGLLRSGGAQSEHGTKYTNPEDIPEALKWWSTQSWSNPFEAHTVYELIHPFDDGNGRSGRILLAAMLNFNFDAVNNLIGSDYFSNLDQIGTQYQGEFWK